MGEGQRDLVRPLHFDASVPNHAASVGFVRKAVAAGAEICGDEAAETVALLFTELVTNAIIHGEMGPDGRIEVNFTVTPQGIRGAVTDEGVGFDRDAGLRPREEGGFGLFIVQQLVRRWGVDRQGSRTQVWFEL